MRTIGLYLYDDVEVLDFAGPFEVFSTASRVALRRRPDAAAPFRVVTIARHRAPVRARAGLPVLPETTLADHPPLDALIVPGGDERAERGQADLRHWLRTQAAQVEVLASVCTGAFLLAGAGLLDGRTVTTHWEDVAELAAAFPALTVADTGRWIDDGNIVSSAGISAGIDMSLHLVARWMGTELAMATARQMDYHWRDSPAEPS
ncbi:DJ-1/PfpI family protein [Denitromonas iodatirespirans]|uniref:DJ-1/PfpI family protein n=1 Tax=Denitromonas iodatirespirans TaxID=2795389 RepID=A0A944D8S8_DENI1|nr:DJ-1/PfpI family protein [Denitromonas iodatirespirans]MBT0960017.1 DJ-1/PfpI family protein [Denitromonas iodatirespirans]